MMYNTKRVFSPAILLVLIAVAVFAYPSGAAPGAVVSGTVYDDANTNGMREFGETGVSGVTVTATDPAGMVVSGVTDAAGNFSLSIAASGPYRVEFSGLPAGYYPSKSGGTSVQFASGLAPVSYAITNKTQGEFTGKLALPIYWVNPTGASLAQPAMITFNHADVNNNIPSLTGLATHAQIGVVNGIAYHAESNSIFAAAFVRKGAHYPNGIGAIYRVSANNSFSPTLFLDLGSSVGTYANTIGEVGEKGLGGIELSADQNTLYLVDITNKRLLSIDVATKTQTAATLFAVPSDCTPENTHPFAVTVKGSNVYVGVTCGGSSVDDARGYVYRLDGFAFTQVLNFPFNYRHLTRNKAAWFAWTATGGTGSGSEVVIPWIVDLEFDGDDILIGVRNRFTDQVNAANSVAGGDVLRACSDGAGGWVMESNATCGGVATGGAGNNQGLGGGEYYFEDNGVEGEASYGSLAVIESLDLTYSTQGDIMGHYGNFGVMQLRNSNGEREKSARLSCGFSGCSNNALAANGLGKSNHYGDIEALNTLPPLEVGNRVWNDADQDGIQDPTELGLTNIAVNLWNGAMTTVLGTVQTSATGEYYFNVSPDTEYCIKVDMAQPALAGLALTSADTATDTIDSDGVLDGTLAAYCFKSGAAGASDHTIDFGFTGELPPTETPTATNTPVGPTPTPTMTPTPIPGLVSYGNYVWYDDDRDGQQEETEAPVPGVKMCAGTAAGAPVLDEVGKPICSVTDANGLYLFRDLQPGSYCTRFDLATLPSNYAVTAQNVLANTVDTVDSDADPETGLACETGAIPAGGQNLTVDMGIAKVHACIGNYVWHDSNINGVQDPGETPFPNAVAELFTSAGVSTGITDTTGIDGAYLLCAEAGQYYVQFTLPGSAKPSPSNQGGDDAKDSDVDPATLRTAVITLPAVDPDDLTFDLGVFLPTSEEEEQEPGLRRVLLPLIKRQ